MPSAHKALGVWRAARQGFRGLFFPPGRSLALLVKLGWMWNFSNFKTRGKFLLLTECILGGRDGVPYISQTVSLQTTHAEQEGSRTGG